MNPGHLGIGQEKTNANALVDIHQSSFLEILLGPWVHKSHKRWDWCMIVHIHDYIMYLPLAQQNYK